MANIFVTLVLVFTLFGSYTAHLSAIANCWVGDCLRHSCVDTFPRTPGRRNNNNPPETWQSMWVQSENHASHGQGVHWFGMGRTWWQQNQTPTQIGARVNCLAINQYAYGLGYYILRWYSSSIAVRIASKDSQLRRNKSKCRLHYKLIECLPDHRGLRWGYMTLYLGGYFRFLETCRLRFVIF